MPTENYDVQLRIGAVENSAASSVAGVAKQLLGLQSGTLGATQGISRMLRGAVAFGATYVGFQAVSNAMRSLIVGSVGFGAQMEKTKVGLGAVLAATLPAMARIADTTERMNMAGKVGDAIFRQLQDDAINSVASSTELSNIFAGIAGPLLGAGAALSDVRQVTLDAASAAASLNVDFAQAQRDIVMMANGVAGADVKLFQALRSTKAIVESSEQWNKMLPEKRLVRIQEALATYGPAADRFGKSLPGALSSFGDFLTQFRMAFAGPSLVKFTQFLNRFNAYLKINKDRILSLITSVGNGVATVFDWMFKRVESWTAFFVSNWDRIAQRIADSLEGMKAFAQRAAPVAGIAAAGAVASRIAPTAAGAVGTAAMSPLKAAFAHVSTQAQLFVTALQVAGVSFGVLTAIFGVGLGVIGALADVWKQAAGYAGVLGAILWDVVTVVAEFALALGSALWPVVKTIGAVILAIAVPAFTLLISVVVALWGIARLLFKGLAVALSWVGGVWNTYIYEPLSKVLGAIFDYAAKFLRMLGVGMNAIDKPGTAASSPGWLTELMSGFDEAMAALGKQKADDKTTLAMANAGGAPGARPKVVNDFRGSKFEVKQDLRGEDPDRYWLLTVRGINDAAQSRLSSALAPDFAG